MAGFHGGIHPPQHEDASLVNAVKIAASPQRVFIPIVQHIGAPSKIIVKTGQTVAVGSLLAEPGGFVSAAVHSSVSGKVVRVCSYPHPSLVFCDAVEIESDSLDTMDASIKDRDNVDGLSSAEIVGIVRDCGVVGLGGAAFPTHVKLSPPKDKVIDTVVINGAECEPYLTCDHTLMLRCPVEIIKGILLVMKAVGAKRAFIGIEDNKMEAVEVLKSKIRGMNIDNIETVPLKVKYPQGAEKQLISALIGKEVPCGGLPMDVGVVVQNVGTTFAIYEAVYKNKPLYERMLTVAGRCVKTAQNVKVRIGTRFIDVIKEIGGLINYPSKVIMGGPMMGIAQDTMDVPVVKATSGILTGNVADFVNLPSSPCIRCGRCVSVCPMGLIPCAITAAGDSNNFDKADALGVRDCMECGSCAYVCPAKRKMVHTVKKVKAVLLRRKRDA